MFEFVFGVLGAFGDHERKQRKGNSAQSAKHDIHREKDVLDAVKNLAKVHLALRGFEKSDDEESTQAKPFRESRVV